MPGPTAPDQQTLRQLGSARWLVLLGAAATATNLAIAAAVTWLTPDRGTGVFVLSSALVGTLEAVAGAVLLQRRTLK